MKLLKKIINVILTLIIVIAIIIILLLLIGIKSYVALSGSMEPAIETGSLCFVNIKTKYEDIKEQDVIAYKMDDDIVVIHRVVEVNDKQLITKGDVNDYVDSIVVTKDNYIGKNIFNIPKIGYIVRALYINCHYVAVVLSSGFLVSCSCHFQNLSINACRPVLATQPPLAAFA